MKRLMLIGATIGFGTGLGVGLLTEGSQWSGILFRSSVCAVVGGFLLRWLGRVWVTCLREAFEERLAAQAAAEAAAEAQKQGVKK